MLARPMRVRRLDFRSNCSARFFGLAAYLAPLKTAATRYELEIDTEQKNEFRVSTLVFYLFMIRRKSVS